MLAAGRVKSSARKGTQKDGNGNMDMRETTVKGRFMQTHRRLETRMPPTCYVQEFVVQVMGLGIMRCGRKLVGVDLFRNERCDWLMASYLCVGNQSLLKIRFSVFVEMERVFDGLYIATYSSVWKRISLLFSPPRNEETKPTIFHFSKAYLVSSR